MQAFPPCIGRVSAFLLQGNLEYVAALSNEYVKGGTNNENLILVRVILNNFRCFVDDVTFVEEFYIVLLWENNTLGINSVRQL